MGSGEQRLICTTVPTTPKLSVERNDVPMGPRPQAAEGAVLDEYSEPDLFVLRKFEAAAPTTSGIYEHHLALSATLLVKNLVWIPDSLSVLDDYKLQLIWAMLFMLFILVVPGSLKFEPAPAVVVPWVTSPLKHRPSPGTSPTPPSRSCHSPSLCSLRPVDETCFASCIKKSQNYHSRKGGHNVSSLFRGRFITSFSFSS